MDGVSVCRFQRLCGEYLAFHIFTVSIKSECQYFSATTSLRSRETPISSSTEGVNTSGADLAGVGRDLLQRDQVIFLAVARVRKGITDHLGRRPRGSADRPHRRGPRLAGVLLQCGQATSMFFTDIS